MSDHEESVEAMVSRLQGREPPRRVRTDDATVDDHYAALRGDAVLDDTADEEED